MLGRRILLLVSCVVLVFGCSSKPKLSQLSGKVTFKGHPVPAGFISFTPDVANGNNGQITVLQVKDGAYDSAQKNPPGIKPGFPVTSPRFNGRELRAGAHTITDP